MFNNEPVTKTDKTIKDYEKRTEGLFKRAERELGKHNITWLEMAEWARNIVAPEVAAATWRQYRAALVHGLKIWMSKSIRFTPEKSEMIRSEAEKAEAILKSPLKRVRKKRSVNTSATKMKYIKKEDLDNLTDYLLNAGGNKAVNLGLLNWIKSTITAGLRPIEWQDAQWIEVEKKDEIDGNITKVPALKVKNAKQTNGRAHGEYRTIPLGNVSATELQIIEKHMEVCHRMASIDQFKFYYEECRQKMKVATRQLWPKRQTRPTLYSARHQFSADCKARGLSEIEIAALMGHAVEDTAQTHYGKKVSGTQGPAIEAHDEDVQKVKISNKSNPHRKIDDGEDLFLGDSE